jgi:hypothetical protein
MKHDAPVKHKLSTVAIHIPKPSRRVFLRGLVASLALPWLETFQAPVWAQAQNAPHRFIAFYVPNGFNMNQFWPTQTGDLNANSFTGLSLEPLQDFRQQLLLLNGLDNYAGTAQGDGPGDHARGTCTFLTSAHPLKSANELRNGISLDQALAQHWAGQTPFASLEVGCEGGGNAGSCDSGYSCAYSRNIAWQNAATPLPKEVNPRTLFNRIFGNIDPQQSPEAIATRERRQRSILDSVTVDAQRLLSQVSVSDQQRIDQYLSGIRDLERRLEDQEIAQCQALVDEPVGIPSDRATHARLLLDVIVSALQCNQTHVSTFMLGNGGSNRAYPELGISEGHHTLSHHQQNADSLSKLAVIDQWEIGLLAHLLQRLNESNEGNGSLLDNTTVLFSSECEDGNAHRHTQMPMILAGKACSWRMGRYLDLRDPNIARKPIADLYLSILQNVGAAYQSFGDDGQTSLMLPA